MATRVNPNPFKATPSPSPEKAKAPSSFGWMDTALLVSGTLICGGVFSPACGLVYALVYMGGKLSDESPNPTPKACLTTPQPPSVKEKKVISLIEEADVVIQKTDAAANQIKPVSPKAAPLQSVAQETSLSTMILMNTQDNTPAPIVEPISMMSVVEPDVETQKSKEVEKKNPPPLVETAKSSLLDLPTVQKEPPVFNLPEAIGGAKENLFSLMEAPTVPVPIADTISPATQSLPTPSVEIKPEPALPAVPKESLKEARPNSYRIPLPEAPLTNPKKKSLASKPISVAPATALVPPTAINGRKAASSSIASSQRTQPQKSNWFQTLFGGKKVPGRLPGITNQGNTCFAASVFHFIADNPVFANHLVELMPDASKKFFQKWLPIYQKEKAEGKEQSSVPIREMRRLLLGSGGQIRGSNQEDAHDLLMGILGSILIQLDSDPTISLETLQEAHKALLKNPLLRIKTEQKTFYVGKETSLEGTNLVRYPSNLEHAYSLKRTIEIPVLDVQFMRDQKGIVSLPLPLMLEQNWFYDRASDSDEPYKLKNNCVALPVHTEISFDKPPEVLIVTLARFHGAQKIQTPVDVPLTMTLPLNATAKREEAEYELKGTVIHSGTTLRGGHYISEGISLDSKGKQQIWSASDKHVQAINSASFADHAAHSYMQLYTKKS